MTFGVRMMPATGSDVPDEIEIELLVERGVDRVCRTYRQERVAVGRRAHHSLGGEVGAGPRPVLNDKLLTEPLRQPLSHESREDVSAGAGGKADDDAYRAVSDSSVPRTNAKRPGARQRPLPNAEIDGAEGPRCPLSALTSEELRQKMRRGIATVQYISDLLSYAGPV